MQFFEAEIREVTEAVWGSVLGVHLVPRPLGPAVTDQVISGWVRFSGAWEGAMTIECSADFARQAAATMLGIEPAAASVSDSRDAVGELANMTGGNVKALLPGPCRLSLPSVVEECGPGTRAPAGELVTTVAFDCQGSSLVVRLLWQPPRQGA